MQFPSLARAARRVVPRALLLLSASTTTVSAQTTFGEALIPRQIFDTFSNFITISTTPFTPATFGQTLSSFSMFGGTTSGGATNVGLSLTPLLVSVPVAGSFSVVGVGTTRTVASGINSWAFGLTSGSAVVGSNVYFAWLSNGQGSVQYTDGVGPAMLFTSNSAVNSVPAAGSSFQTTLATNRAYSIQWTVGTPGTPPPPPVPEPSAVVLMATGLAGLAVARRRRRATGGALGPR